MVHTRPPESRIHGSPDPVQLWGLALSRNVRGAVQGLCQHMAQDQARSQWLARLGGRRWNQAPAIHPWRPTWTSSWPASRPVGPHFACTKHWSCWGNKCCILTPTLWSTWDMTGHQTRPQRFPWGLHQWDRSWYTIVEFVSGGPKKNGYNTHDGKVECNVRGLCLNKKGKAQLNYKVMQDNVLKEIRDPQSQPCQTQVVKTNPIVRDAKSYELYTFPEYKCYQLECDKLAIDPVTFQTYPYGREEAMDWTFLWLGSRDIFLFQRKQRDAHPLGVGSRSHMSNKVCCHWTMFGRFFFCLFKLKRVPPPLDG